MTSEQLENYNGMERTHINALDVIHHIANPRVMS